MEISELPAWLSDECKQDPTMRDLVYLGVKNKCSLERILDTVARFVLDREQLAMKQLWRYRSLHGKLPDEENPVVADKVKNEKPILITAASTRHIIKPR